jgi:hypothetical protein
MTLILGMSKGEGLYLSTDHRVTDVRSGRLIDDASVKVLKLLYPPLEDGPKALVAYTGAALLRNGTPHRDVDRAGTAPESGWRQSVHGRP